MRRADKMREAPENVNGYDWYPWPWLNLSSLCAVHELNELKQFYIYVPRHF
jgi:hypothetical protein